MPLTPPWALDLLTVSPFSLYFWIIKQASWPALPDVATVWLSRATGGISKNQCCDFLCLLGKGLQFSDSVGASEGLQGWEASRLLLLSKNTASGLITKLQVLPKERDVKNILTFQYFSKIRSKYFVSCEDSAPLKKQHKWWAKRSFH